MSQERSMELPQQKQQQQQKRRNKQEKKSPRYIWINIYKHLSYLQFNFNGI